MSAAKSPPTSIVVKREELAELLTQLAFYAGWANGISAAQVAKQVYEERGA